jgi:RNA polymerase-interacting CarD/CdnL/TRCF family regulator
VLSPNAGWATIEFDGREASDLEQIWPPRHDEETWSLRYKRNRVALERGTAEDIGRVVEELKGRERQGRITASERRQLRQAKELMPPPLDDEK